MRPISFPTLLRTLSLSHLRIFANRTSLTTLPATPHLSTTYNPARQIITRYSLPTFPFLGAFFSSSSSSSSSQDNSMAAPDIQKTDQEWRAVLSPEQFRVIREKGTEAPFTGEYDKHMPSDGVYTCAACSTPLYTASHKFKSGCGWPAYFDSIPGAVKRHTDSSFGMARTEITCAKCGGHLGHVFKGEGYPTPTDERHCVNSVSLKFSKEDAGAAGTGEGK